MPTFTSLRRIKVKRPPSSLTITTCLGSDLHKEPHLSKIRKLRFRDYGCLRHIYAECLDPYYTKRTKNNYMFAIVRVRNNPVAITSLEKMNGSIMANAYTQQRYRKRGFAKLATKTALKAFKIPKNKVVRVEADGMLQILNSIKQKASY